MPASINRVAMPARKPRDHLIPAAPVESSGVAEEDRGVLTRPFPKRKLDSINGNSTLEGHSSSSLAAYARDATARSVRQATTRPWRANIFCSQWNSAEITITLKVSWHFQTKESEDSYEKLFSNNGSRGIAPRKWSPGARHHRHMAGARKKNRHRVSPEVGFRRITERSDH